MAMFLYLKSLGLIPVSASRPSVGRSGEFLSERRGDGEGLPGRRRPWAR